MLCQEGDCFFRFFFYQNIIYMFVRMVAILKQMVSLDIIMFLLMMYWRIYFMSQDVHNLLLSFGLPISFFCLFVLLFPWSLINNMLHQMLNIFETFVLPSAFPLLTPYFRWVIDVLIFLLGDNITLNMMWYLFSQNLEFCFICGISLISANFIFPKSFSVLSLCVAHRRIVNVHKVFFLVKKKHLYSLENLTRPF